MSNTVSDPDLPIADVVAACLRHAPAADVQLLVAHPESLTQELYRDGIDIALTPPLNVGADYTQTLFYHDRHSLYCSGTHPLASAGSETTPEDIIRYPFCARSYANNIELSAFPDAVVRIQSSTMEAMAMFVLSGKVIGFLPDHFVTQWLQTGKMKLIGAGHRYLSPFMIVSKKSKRKSALQKLFLSQLSAFVNGSPSL